MEQGGELPDCRVVNEVADDNSDFAVPTVSSSEGSENWENISEDWVSLFLDPAILDDHSSSFPLDIGTYPHFNCTFEESNDQFSSQELLTDSLVLHSSDGHLSHSDLVIGSSTDVLEVPVVEEGPADKTLECTDLKGEPPVELRAHESTVSIFLPITLSSSVTSSTCRISDAAPPSQPMYFPTANGTQVACAPTCTQVFSTTSPASSLTQISGGSNSGMDSNAWKDKEANPEMSIMIKRESTGEVSSGSESPTSLSNAPAGESGYKVNAPPNNPVQSSSYILQCEEEGIGPRDAPSTDSIARAGTPSSGSQSETFGVRHFHNISNVTKTGRLGRSGDRDGNAEDTEESNRPRSREHRGAESFKVQSQDIHEDQQSDHSDPDRKGDVGDEDDEKRRARLMRNRESAQLSRQRKKVYVDELEGRLRTMAATVAELNATISHLTAENVNLRRQLGYYYPAPGVCPRPGVPMLGSQILPMGPYPGMVAGRPLYPGGPMPPVPIPRIKPQTPARSSKRSKPGGMNEGGDKKRTKLKAAGAASMAVMGLLCVAMLFSSYDQSFNGSVNSSEYTRLGSMRVGGRVLQSWSEARNPLNSTEVRTLDYGPGWVPLEEGEYGPEREGIPSVHTRLVAESAKHETQKSQKNVVNTDVRKKSSALKSIDGNTTLGTPVERGSQSQSDCFGAAQVPLLMGTEVLRANSSQSFAASVFVPGDNGLVKVDGNLIIQAVMAGDKAAKKTSERKSKGGAKKTKGMKHSPLASTERQALRSISGTTLDNLASRGSKLAENNTTKPLANNIVTPVLRAGSLQQWVLGGLHDSKSNFTPSSMKEKNILQSPSQLPVDNSKAVTAIQGTFYSFTPFDAAPKGPLHSWIFSGLSTGPVLSTGMCTELFQFDTSPAATTPAQGSDSNAKDMAESVAAKAAAEGSPDNVTSTISIPVVPRSRRDPFAVPLPPVKPKGSADREEGTNGTDPRVEKLVREQMHSQNLRDGVSSMVVSVLAGPEEYGDNRRKGTKGMSRIFVVVLVDNQKYVTYSCILPSGGPQRHVVAD